MEDSNESTGFSPVLRRLWFAIEQDGRWHALPENEQDELSNQAIALIAAYVANGPLCLVKGYRCAHDVWHGLERVFRAQSIGRKYALHEKFHSVQKRSNESVLMFVARAENLREELAGTCDDRIPEDLFFSYIVGGLGPRFDDVWKRIRFSGLESMNLETLKGWLMLAEAEIIEGPPARTPVVSTMQEQCRCYGCG
jgi:hypothetical protein